MIRFDKRQLAWDVTRTTQRLAYWAGVASHKIGALSIRAEQWYYRLTERERG